MRQLIGRGRAPRRLVVARDVGVSYFVFGVAGALSGYVRRPWRARCRAAVVTALVGNLAIRPTFTEVGHLPAFLVGLAAVPLAPDRDDMTYPQLPSLGGRPSTRRMWAETPVSTHHDRVLATSDQLTDDRRAGDFAGDQ